MTVAEAARWRRLEALFAAAVELAPEERSAWIGRACDGDDALRRELTALLAADAADASLLEEAVASTARSLADADAGAALGRRVGAYRLVREIGRGGMSSVYLAVRDDDAFEQQVAVKLLHPGFESGEILRRFLDERQILAGLAHPYIAALLDGGSSTEGRPYFVLEYVEGEPIDAWCDQRRLPVSERLRLFLKVCEAVQAAHRNLVVHRDLKPSNVLVTADGVPKLLDFGIAKPLAPGSGLDGDLTRTGWHPMTPHYASPEQIRGAPVTTASDVYSLGVLLYRLLTGRLPHPVAGRGAAAWENEVLHGAAERPSSAALRADETAAPARVAELRSTSPALLRRRLAGDLDTVLAKALAKEPKERYGSVEQLADDVARHLDGRPVVARPATVRYRTAKFLARHRWGAAVVALALVAILAASAALALQARRLAHERDRANQVADLLVDLFAIADPRQARGGSITARELLDRGAERVESLDGQPRTQSMLLGKLAELYEPLGLYPQAADLLHRALDLDRRAGGDHPELARHLNHLGRVLAQQGDYDAAAPLFGESLAMYERLEGGDGPEVSMVLNNLALVHHDLGDYAAAEAGYRRAIDLETRRRGAPHPYTVGNYGLLLLDLGDYAGAERIIRGLVDDERRAGDDDEALASAVEHLGLVELAQGRLADAAASLGEAVELRSRLFGREHPETARSIAALGVVRREQGRLGEAEGLLAESLAARRNALGDDHPEVADGLREIALLEARRGRGRTAEAAFREALAVQERSLSPNHPLTGLTLGGLGALLAADGDCAAARPLLARALELVPERDWRRPPAAAALRACR